MQFPLAVFGCTATQGASSATCFPTLAYPVILFSSKFTELKLDGTLGKLYLHKVNIAKSSCLNCEDVAKTE